MFGKKKGKETYITTQDIKGFERVINFIESEQKGRGLYRFKGIGRVEIQILKKVELGEGKVDMVFKTADKKDIKKLLKSLNTEIGVMEKL